MTGSRLSGQGGYRYAGKLIQVCLPLTKPWLSSLAPLKLVWWCTLVLKSPSLRGRRGDSEVQGLPELQESFTRYFLCQALSLMMAQRGQESLSGASDWWETDNKQAKPGFHYHCVVSVREETNAKRGVGRARKWGPVQEGAQGHFRGRKCGVWMSWEARQKQQDEARKVDRTHVMLKLGFVFKETAEATGHVHTVSSSLRGVHVDCSQVFSNKNPFWIELYRCRSWPIEFSEWALTPLDSLAQDRLP